MNPAGSAGGGLTAAAALIHPDDPQAPSKPTALRLHEAVAPLPGGAVDEKQRRGVLRR